MAEDFAKQRKIDCDRYLSQLFSQLVCNGVAVDYAYARAKEAANLLFDKGLEFPTIIIG